jgi:CBS domain-containing protein
MKMKVADVMTRRVVSVKPETPIVEAARLMLQDDISGLPVIDAAGALVGIITEGDFLRRGETHTEKRRPRWLEFLLGPGRLAEDYTRTHGKRVGEVMTREVATALEETPLEEAVRLMEKRRIKRLPVLRQGRVVGVISRANLMHALATLAGEAKPPAATDRTIRDGVLAELEKQPWGASASTTVIVRDGVVELGGVIFDEREREAMRVAAENVPGVKSVRDHLVWVEPNSGFVIEAPEEGQEPPGAAR